MNTDLLLKQVENISIEKQEIEEVPPIEQELIEYALSFEGGRYVWGGESLEHGVDCSAFVMLIYKEFGYYLPRTSAEQYRYCRDNNLLLDDYSELKAGDIVLYEGHVALITGNSETEIIHAKGAKYGIVVSPTYTYKNVKGIARLIQ